MRKMFEQEAVTASTSMQCAVDVRGTARASQGPWGLLARVETRHRTRIQRPLTRVPLAFCLQFALLILGILNNDGDGVGLLWSWFRLL